MAQTDTINYELNNSFEISWNSSWTLRTSECTWTYSVIDTPGWASISGSTITIGPFSSYTGENVGTYTVTVRATYSNAGY